MRLGEGGGVRRGLGIERRGDHDGELCPRPEGSGRGTGTGGARDAREAVGLVRLRLDLRLAVLAPRQRGQGAHRSRSRRARASVAARWRGPICSPSVGRDDDERAVGRRRPGRAADWNLARRAPEVEVLTRRRPFGTHFDPRSDTRRPTPFGRRARDGRTDHRHRGRPRRPLRRAHRAGARRARPPLG